MSKLINQEAIVKLSQGLHQKAKDLVEVERQRALAAEGVIDAKVEQNIADIQAINNAETGILKQAKDYVDEAIHSVDAGAIKDRVDAIESKNTEQDEEIAKKVAKEDVVNELTETVEGKVLDARQGKVLKDLVDGEIARATGVEEVLSGRLDVIEGVGEGSISKTLEDAKGYTDEKIGEVSSTVSTLEGRVATNENEISNLKDLVSNKNNNTIVVETEEEISVENPTPKVGDLAFVISTKRAYIYKGTQAVVLSEVPAGWVVFDEITNELDLVDYLKKSDAEAIYRKIADKIVEGDLDTALVSKIDGKADQVTLESEIESVKEFATAEAQREAGVVDGKLTTAKEELQGNIDGVSARVEANEGAIAILNGEVGTEGSVAKKISDALSTYSDTEAVKALLTNVVGSLDLSIVEDQIVLSAGGVDGVTISTTSLDLVTEAEIDEILATLQ